MEIRYPVEITALNAQWSAGISHMMDRVALVERIDDTRIKVTPAVDTPLNLGHLARIFDGARLIQCSQISGLHGLVGAEAIQQRKRRGPKP